MIKNTFITLFTKNDAPIVNAKKRVAKNKIPANCHAKEVMKKEITNPKMIASAKTAIPKI